MSSLSKMQIRGIRSFSPDRDETIEFYSPLTMIVGANGCGKTTIIESLKFSCTGSLPPNTKSGHLFVNDPSMTDATEVKAHIKLRFQNRSDQTCVSVRSLQVSKKRSKMEFKALEGVLRTTNANGEKVSISLKCSDMDRVFPENLGVSPAILENVIFCHQEESNWPMQEGIVLKKKFDDVFESTRYTKALEAYSKAKKEFQGKAKDLKAELMEFGAHLLAANQAKDELKTCEETQEMCNEELEKIAERLERNEAQLRACREVLEAAKGSEAELTKVQLLITEAERRVFDKTQSLESKLDGSDEEIQASIANFNKMVAEREKELQRMEELSDNLSVEVAMIRSEMDQLSIAKGKAVVLQQSSAKFKEDQISMSRSLQRKYNLALPATNWTPTAAKDYTQHIRNELVRTQAEAAEVLATARRAVDSADKQHSEVKSAVQKLDVELNLKTEEAHSMMSEADQKRSEITKLSSSRNTIQQCQVDFDDAKKTLDEFMESYNLKANDLKKNIKDATDQIRNLQDLIAEDANTLQEMSLHRNEIANLETSLKQIEIESSQITLDLSGVVRVHREAMAEFSDATKDCNDLNRLMPRVQEKFKTLQKDHSTAREELSQLKSKLAANEALLEQEQKRAQKLYAKLDQLSSKEKSINPCVDQLNELRRSRVFAESKLSEISYAEAKINDLVNIAKQTMDEAHELLIIAKSGQIFMKRFKKSRAKNNGDCPCCKQSMTPAIAEAYEVNMKSLFLIGSETSQCSVEEHTTTFDACLQFYEDIQKLQASLQPLMDVREEIKVADVKVIELNQTSNVIRDEIQALEQTVRERDAKCTSFGKIIQDLNDINVRWESVSKRKSEFLEKRKRQSQTLLTQGDSGGRSMAEMEHDQRNRMEQKDELQAKKDRLMNDDANLQKRLFSLKNMVSEREKAWSDAKIEGNRYSELETALNTLQVKLQDFESRKSVLVSEKSVLTKQASDASALLSKAKADLQQTTELWDGKVNMIKGDFEAFNKLVEGFEDVEKQYQDLNLADVSLSFDRLQAQVAAKEEEREAGFPKINALTAELKSQEHIKRNMHANLELRNYEQELRGLKQQLSALEKTSTSSAAKLKATEKEYQAFTKESQSLTSERDTIRGKLAVHNQQVAELKGKLNNSTYKGIEEKHRRKNIEYETTNLAVQDLESYSTALDKALQNFHTLKIKEINRIIRELWQLIYKGQDIDMIELESGADESAAGARGSKSYNYRVVMRKGDVPLDMRGRCSAGQKVLAAIVIRLALAETFCLNCGMLALDEPTTNLDEPNKLGLAHALSRIIVGRSKQNNFQLICITHDEEFVKMMSDELSVTADFNMPEYYFRIYRQEEGNTGKFFSHIERVPWEDM